MTHETSLDVEAVGAFLDRSVPGLRRGPLRATLLAGGRSNPTYEVTDGEQSWILRRPPYGHFISSAHDVLREQRLMAALQGSKVPVPSVVAACEDTAVLGAPFYLMDKVTGRTFRTPTDTASLSADEQGRLSQAMVDVLVDLHSVDPEQVGLPPRTRADGYLTRQIERWYAQWNKVATGERPEVPWLVEVLRRSMPETTNRGIVHGDYKIDNVMVSSDDPATVVAVLDWEMATVGDTLADLGLLLSFWDGPGEFHNPITAGATAHPGFMRSAQIAESYANQTGCDLDRLDWYVAFSDFKVAVILEQIHARHREGTTVGDGFDDIGSMVQPLLERAVTTASISRYRRLHDAAH
jgi:aminoglycoside phosphotransferase (APT) family kinase protein